MALEVPRTFLADARRSKPRDIEERLFHLAPHHIQVLQDVAQGVEETDVGVCCSYLVDSTSGEGADFDEFALNRVERYVESALSFDARLDANALHVVKGWRSRLQRCRRTIARLHIQNDHTTVGVLMSAYGHPDPIAHQIPELVSFGPLGSLVRYTEVVERKRLELVRFETFRRTQPTDGITDLSRVRAYQEWVNRVVTSGDALRAACEAFAEPAPKKDPAEPVHHHEARKAARKEREEAHKNRRNAFLTEARIEAAKLLARAEKRYQDAWFRSAV